MKEYWKVKLMKELLAVEELEKDNGTITMEYIYYRENQLRLVSQAYEDGWNAAVLKDEVKDDR